MRYTVNILWQKNPEESFTDKKYSRAHKWKFDGGTEVMGSSSPQVVNIPMSDEIGVDPEEAFVASISSCHMLFFLSIAAAHKFIIERYEDNAEGILSKNENGKMVMTLVNLKPVIKFSGTNLPSPEEINKIHDQSHEECYIANSIKTEIKVIRE